MKRGRRRGHKNEHVPIARKTKLGVGPERAVSSSRVCRTLRTDTAKHCKRKGVREEDWAALDLKTLLSGLDKRALASMQFLGWTCQALQDNRDA